MGTPQKTIQGRLQVGALTVGGVDLDADMDELDLLDGSVAGTVVASKAVIYDANGAIAMDSLSPVAAGSSVADATAMTAQFNTVTGADGTTGVLLPVAAADKTVTVVNTVANQILKVYAVTGSQINALGSTNAFSLGAGQMAVFVGRSATLWYTASAADTIGGLTASAAELNLNDTATAGTVVASKTVVAGANKNLDTLAIADGGLKLGAGAGTAVTSTAAELNQLDGAILSDGGMAAGTGITTAAGGFSYHRVTKIGDLFKTEILFDITGLNDGGAGVTAAVVGKDGDTANCHLGQIVAAVNGTIIGGRIHCLETPGTGNADIDLYTANEGTLAQDTAIASATGEVKILDGDTFAAGDIIALVAFPPADDYLILTMGSAGSDQDYSAGQFMLELWGV